LSILPRDLLFQRYGVDGPRIVDRRLLDQNPFLSALLRGGAQAPRAFGQVRDTLPLRIAPDAPELLADELFGDELAVNQVGHGSFG
jgi:hypothetical protein